MTEHNRYFAAVAKKVSDWCEKPLTIIATMAFLFPWTFVMSAAGLPAIGIAIINTAIAIIILLLVLILQNTHKQDIRALHARLDALVSEQREDLKGLSEAELQQIRYLLKQQAADDRVGRPSNRDNRPSLF